MTKKSQALKKVNNKAKAQSKKPQVQNKKCSKSKPVKAESKTNLNKTKAQVAAKPNKPKLHLVKGNGGQKTSTTKAAKKCKKFSVEELILEHRENGRKLGRSMLRRWNVKLQNDDIDSLVDLALCEAANRFRQDKGASFITFYFYHLRGHLVRTIAAAANASNVFVSSIGGGNQENADYATSSADITNWFLPESAMSREQDLETPESILIKKQQQEKCSELVNKLDLVEQEILSRSLVSEEALVEVAKSLGYSRCHVSRVKKRAIDKLRRYVNAKNVGLGHNDDDLLEIVNNEIRNANQQGRGRRRTLLRTLSNTNVDKWRKTA